MHILYLHGFRSGTQSIKAQQLKAYCAKHRQFTFHCPDLNAPPRQVIAKLADILMTLQAQQQPVALIGSSLGGFYATYFVAKFHLPVVLINPVVRPWQVFAQRYNLADLPLYISPQWQLDATQLQDLKLLAINRLATDAKVLLLIQRGDEVLDYREAERYYSQVPHNSLIISELGGDHSMSNFSDKIPMLLEFLSYSVQ
ncbi:YqiA/YcfP family alpha/beta fold hydrolase [Acinetobacter larvae]|uniref:Esterase n=1 Tax=Acinetobacter larvae TaxID=1789224 RepID=A0A1B2M3U6_9GAMM|nr:YqiA/YcfP family alpha/beta fold hydrolase [Acinetobacter larvae]AOA59713.1 esterase [Acinetobacter larvae]